MGAMGRESSGISAKETRGGSLHIAEILFRQAACKTNNYFGDSVWVISEFSVKHWPYTCTLYNSCKNVNTHAKNTTNVIYSFYDIFTLRNNQLRNSEYV